MELVIKISEEDYNLMKARVCKSSSDYLILDGTPLPKGHGRLIDADKLRMDYCNDNCGERKCVDAMDRCVFIDAVLDASTIIEGGVRSNVE